MESVVPEGGFAILSHISTDGRASTCAKFDTHEQLLWTANANGHVTSYFEPGLSRYTAFQMFPAGMDTSVIQDMLTLQGGIVALSPNKLTARRRQGLNWFSFSNERMQECRCMSLCWDSPNQMLIAGAQSHMILFNVETGQEIKATAVQEEDCQIMRVDDRYIYTSDSRGKVTIRNGQTFDVHNVVQLHEGMVADITVCGNQMVTCGYTNRNGHTLSDRFLMVYDVRNMRIMTPVSATISPSFVRFLPTYSDNRLVTASQTGDVRIFDMGNHGQMYSLDTQGMPICAMDVSTSLQCIVFTDAAGFIHLMSDRATPVFNVNSQPTDFPDPEPPPPTSISYNDLITPFTLIPAPLPQNGTYASDWPAELIRKVHREPLPVEPVLLESMRMVQFVGYAPNPGTRRRNQIPYDMQNVHAHAVSNEKQNNSGDNSQAAVPNGANTEQIQVQTSRSAEVQQTTHTARQPARRGGLPLQSPSGRGADDPFALVPKLYRKVHTRLNKFGSEDFDFSRYNSTQLTAIDAPAPHAYMASFLVVLSRLASFKNLLYAHLCENEFCLSCELSFLLRMCDLNLNKQPCSATNFLRALRTFPQSAALDLFGGEKEINNDMVWKVQTFAEIVLKIVFEELKTCEIPAKICASPSSPVFENKTDEICEKYPFRNCVGNVCNCENGKLETTVSIVFPEGLEEGSESNFLKILNHSMNVAKSGNCEVCGSDFKKSPEFRNLADVLVLDTKFSTDIWQKYCKVHEKYSTIKAALESISKQQCKFGERCKRPSCRYMHSHIEGEAASEDDETGSAVGESGHWLLPNIYVENVDNKVSVLEAPVEGSMQYVLHSLVFLIRENTEEHLVTCVQTDGHWVVYNDFIVEQTNPDDAMHMNMHWKVPAIIVYAKAETLQTELVKYEEVSPITWSVFCMDEVRRRLSSSSAIAPLEQDDLPKSGDLVAIDAEFVSINHDDSESDLESMTKNALKPLMSLARVTCIRGDGPKEGVTFMDDYISTQDEVADYLTAFSGIQPGDLHPDSTSKNLTTLKHTYLKLWHLVNNRVVFVGHGLSNDFRVINITVPQCQIRDTVHLFHMPHNRMVSLKFLAWYFLELRIQDETHDSVEDARTALKLYRKYEELMCDGEVAFKNTINTMYSKGKQLQWTVPGS